MRLTAAILPTVILVTGVAAQSPSPQVVWPEAKVQAVLERTARTRLAPDLSHLTPGERTAVAKLLQVGEIFQDLYELQRHRSALTARAALQKATDPRSKDLLTLYRLYQTRASRSWPSTPHRRERTSIRGT